MMAITLSADSSDFVVTLVTNNALYGVSSVKTVTFGSMIFLSAGSRRAAANNWFCVLGTQRL